MADLKRQSSLLATFKRAVEFCKKICIDRPIRSVLEARLERLEKEYVEFCENQNSIEARCNDETLLDNQFATRGQAEDFYFFCSGSLREAIREFTAPNVSPENAPQNGLSRPNAILPKIIIPSFSGTYQEWPSFQDHFCKLIHENASLANVEKMHYLKGYLSGEAADLIKSIQITDANYGEAWEIIKGRYDNKRYIVDAHLRSLTNLPLVKTDNPASLKKLINTVLEATRALAVQGLPVNQWDALLIHMIVNRLDSETHTQWELQLTKNDLPTMRQLQTFIENRWQSLELVGPTKSVASSSSNSQSKRQRESNVSKSQAFVATNTSRSVANPNTGNCPLCNNRHPIYLCQKYRDSTTDQKIEIVKNNNLCYNCLRSEHSVRNCPNTMFCRHCGKKHHSSIHISRVNNSSSTVASQVNFASNVALSNSPNTFSNVHPSNESQQQLPNASANVHLSNGAHQHILLSTAIILVRANNGIFIPTRALLDSGSQSSFVTESLATRLGLKRNPANTSLSGIGQTVIRNPTSIVDVCISSRIDNSFLVSTRALTIDKITGQIPGQTINALNWQHLSNLSLADPEYNNSKDVEILIGADIYGEILIDGIIPRINGSPVAQNTKLGWILTGKIDDVNTLNEPIHTFNFFVESSENPISLDSILRKFWETEELDLTRNLTCEEIQTEQNFQQTHFRNVDGRYTVSLPFNDKIARLGESRTIAVRQLHRMEKRFANNHKLRDEYATFMREYLDLGHMEIVPKSALRIPNENIFYLPHHAVMKESSETTKLRVVFNGSMKTSSGVSLNERLLVGPTIQDDLFSIIVRWRSHKIVFTADVAKMYRQIRINPSHSDYQRIVWRFSESEPVTDYRLTTVTYGTASAAFLAIRALHQLAYDEAINYPVESKIILRDFYVDDLMTGSHDISSALELQCNLIDITQKGGFELRKWHSNCIEFLDGTSAANRDDQPLIEIMDESVKVLGIFWNPNEDCFQFKVAESDNCPQYTKRDILSYLAKQFDPFGWISPVIIIAKIILQKLWLTGISWDDPVPDDIAVKWTTYKTQLPLISRIKIGRWIGSSSIEFFELHGFSDASNDAYAAVVYSRSVSKCGTIKVKLISAKTKVSPIKQISTPRLELNGAVLLSKLINKVKHSFIHRIDLINNYSDSTVVLAWIKGHPNQWKNFVANRLTEIHKYTDVTSWHFVKSQDNPADCASRGVLPTDLESHPLWWHGPVWLRQSRELWPSYKHLQFQTKIEEKKLINTFLVTAENPWLCVFERYSTLDKLIRIVAYWMRFVDNARTSRIGYNKRAGILTVPELRAAMAQCIRMVQRSAFGNEILSLVSGEQLPSKSCIRSLNPYFDGDGFLRVGGRLSKSCLPPQGKFPLILPQKNHFCNLLILKAHETTLHGGSSLTMANLRNQYWILGMRNLVRKCIHNCHTCYRYRCKPSNQIMADLPSQRVTPARAFLSSGVDFAGPITTKLFKGRCNRTAKSYIAVFVCMVTKAIHLELVSELTSDAFLAAFRRFVARRGRCADIFSDCGTNFVGASKELKTFEKHLRQGNFLPTLVNDGTDWHFNPPASPHFGGLWEAGVKSVKYHLRRIAGNAVFTFEELTTILCQIEACLNSRPLCPLSDTVNDWDYLTPGHFLIGEPTLTMPSPSLTHLPTNRLSRWQLMQQRLQDFWKVWSVEYLSRLQQRPKWLKTSPNFKEGQLALIREDNVPPAKWIVGRIISVVPGADNKVRVVMLKTANGQVLKRPIVKLSLLPMSTTTKDEIISDTC